jgi:hypothetical protein
MVQIVTVLLQVDVNAPWEQLSELILTVIQQKNTWTSNDWRGKNFRRIWQNKLVAILLF